MTSSRVAVLTGSVAVLVVLMLLVLLMLLLMVRGIGTAAA